jgi:hypothetical protein
MPCLMDKGSLHWQTYTSTITLFFVQMLKSLKVEMLLLSAIPHLAETWTSTFGFREIDESDKKRLSKVRLAAVPGTVLLKKDLLCECSGADAGEPPSPKPFQVYSRVPRGRTGLDAVCQ